MLRGGRGIRRFKASHAFAAQQLRRARWDSRALRNPNAAATPRVARVPLLTAAAYLVGRLLTSCSPVMKLLEHTRGHVPDQRLASRLDCHTELQHGWQWRVSLSVQVVHVQRRVDGVCAGWRVAGDPALQHGRRLLLENYVA
jgi:hypothetical protein